MNPIRWKFSRWIKGDRLELIEERTPKPLYLIDKAYVHDHDVSTYRNKIRISSEKNFV